MPDTFATNRAAAAAAAEGMFSLAFLPSPPLPAVGGAGPGPAPWQVGKCVDEWTGGDCSHHYMDLHIENMTVDAADAWCTATMSSFCFFGFFVRASHTFLIFKCL